MDLSNTLFVAAPSWGTNHYKTLFLLFLSICFVLLTTFPAYSANNKLESVQDTLGVYVKK